LQGGRGISAVCMGIGKTRCTGESMCIYRIRRWQGNAVNERKAPLFHFSPLFSTFKLLYIYFLLFRRLLTVVNYLFTVMIYFFDAVDDAHTIPYQPPSCSARDISTLPSLIPINNTLHHGARSLPEEQGLPSPLPNQMASPSRMQDRLPRTPRYGHPG